MAIGTSAGPPKIMLFQAAWMLRRFLASSFFFTKFSVIEFGKAKKCFSQEKHSSNSCAKKYWRSGRGIEVQKFHPWCTPEICEYSKLWMLRPVVATAVVEMFPLDLLQALSFVESIYSPGVDHVGYHFWGQSYVCHSKRNLLFQCRSSILPTINFQALILVKQKSGRQNIPALLHFVPTEILIFKVVPKKIAFAMLERTSPRKRST